MDLSRIRQRDLKSVCVVDTSTEKVYKSTHEPTGFQVFLKLLSLSNLGDRACEAIQDNLEYNNKIRSERLIQMMGIYQTPDKMGIVTHWMPNGSVHSLIYQHDLYPVLPLSMCISILTDVAEGLTFLHRINPPTRHRRLKPCNILLDSQYRAKLSDFNFPELQKFAVSVGQDENSQRVYLSPQRLQGEEPTTADDIYSLVIILHELLSRKRPFHENNALKWETEVIRGLRPQPSVDIILKASSLTPSQRTHLSQFTNLCWHLQPKKRPTANECFSHLGNLLQAFSVEERIREIAALVSTKERAMKHSQPCIVEFDIKFLDDSWLTLSHRSRTQSTPEDSTERLSASSPKLKERSVSLPATSPTNHVQLMRPRQVAAWNNEPSWTQGVPRECPISPPALWNYCCGEILKRDREEILKRMTEGVLNNLMDTMRSRLVLSRDDSENINAEPTLRGRTRIWLDILSEKGEEAAKMGLEILYSQRIIPLHSIKPV
ncbi:receptor-interacting serine/threonine-protein kinase 2-like isoform X1 [Hyperolius riggenbachi]|uniref:receptor-interacting serine/threonine-protein kinase 2-like isoform X1 n=1 Tax=Hyperolius riggenbachi TaxID=752182 RepID=UPI0035A2836E